MKVEDVMVVAGVHWELEVPSSTGKTAEVAWQQIKLLLGSCGSWLNSCGLSRLLFSQLSRWKLLFIGAIKRWRGNHENKTSHKNRDLIGYVGFPGNMES